MEDALRSGFSSAGFQVLFEKLAKLVAKEIQLILGIDDGLRKLQRTVLRIQAALDYVEDGRVRFPNNKCKEAWKMWLEDLNRICCDTEDLVDELSFQLADFNGIDQISPEQDMCQKLENMEVEMNTLFMNEMVSKFGALNVLQRTNHTGHTSIIHSSSLVDEHLIVGRKDEKRDILHMILYDQTNKHAVIPIIGMAGIGKTTLAQVVYNSEEVEAAQFSFKIWASLPVEFDAIAITKKILESATNKECKLSTLDSIQGKLQNVLRRKKFLLVLDNFWSEKHEDWEILSLPFRYGEPGSRQRALSELNIQAHEKLEQIGKEIAKKCKGLPLAAKTLGSVLHSKCDEKDWNSILESAFWDLEQDKNDIIPSLALSYYHLPAHLKKCFAYCSIFPQNHEFEVDDLILLWIAEGFVEPNGERRLEDIGKDYFKDLLRRSLFQCLSGNHNSPEICKMHDLIHSMAQSVSSNLCYRMETNSMHWYPSYRSTRHLSLSHDKLQFFEHPEFLPYRSLRTFIFFCKSGVGFQKLENGLLLKFWSLRVLDLRKAGLEKIPGSVDHLKHLRYMNLSENKIQRLPDGICKLLALQTLKLINCYELRELPSGLKNLINLRHLDLNAWGKLDGIPSNLGRLTNLQTLHAFKVGKDEGCSIQELGNMRFLRGSLCIMNLNFVANATQAKEANLKEKPFLNKLELQWRDDITNSSDQEEAVLAGLGPDMNLKELVITNYTGNMFPGWLSLPQLKLTIIQLQGCSSCSILPALGQLPLLKTLYIEGMSSLNFIICLHGKNGLVWKTMTCLASVCSLLKSALN
ncbi:unnamed protein product [Coffea canephora]|uniref:NB-ARC domain-containing protein n=1 Tax=Coffea canephora TaxID=49390 RepID=A0A068V940_COFCA|nr:unnamed protein product [Coffea canephora]